MPLEYLGTQKKCSNQVRLKLGLCTLVRNPEKWACVLFVNVKSSKIFHIEQ